MTRPAAALAYSRSFPRPSHSPRGCGGDPRGYFGKPLETGTLPRMTEGEVRRGASWRWLGPALAVLWVTGPAVAASPGAGSGSADPEAIDAAGTAPGTAPPELHVPRIDDPGIRVDAQLDEPAWAATTLVIDRFWMREPVDEGESPLPTEVRVFHDGQALYFGFRCTGEPGVRVRSHVGQREDINRDDQVGIYLDTFDDDRRAFVFYANAMGVQQDIRMGEDTGWNFEWDARFRSAGRIVGDDYVIEVAIPFESLRFPRGEEQRFGLVLTRKLEGRGEKVTFPHVPRGPGMMSHAATLVGIAAVDPGPPLEIIPSVTFGHGVTRDDGGAMAPDPPLGLESLHSGLTLRWGITSNVSLGLAVHPDFSQVESDPGQLDVNHRYALYLDEKRPFFLEGIDVFRTPMSMLYTRSIVSPIEGLNLNGVEGGWTVGLLHAVDGEPSASVVGEATTPGFMDEDVEGRRAVDNVLRIKRDVGKRGAIGVFLADKEIGDGPTPAAYNRVGGVDAYLPIGKLVTLEGQGLYSMTGETGGDRIHGGAYEIEAALDDGKGDAWLGHSNIGRGFRAETAYRTRVDTLETYGGGGYQFDVGRKALTWVHPWASAGIGHDHDGTFTDQWSDLGVAWKLWRVNTLGIGGMQWHETYEGQRFQGGVGWLRLRSAALDAFRWKAEGWVGSEVNYDPEDLFRGTFYEVSFQGHWRLFRRLTAELVFTHHAMSRPEGGLHYSVQLIRTVWLLALRHDLWIRAVLDLNTYREDLGLELLAAYVPSPGTAVYLGYSEGAAWDDGPLAARDRRVFIKLQVMFKP